MIVHSSLLTELFNKPMAQTQHIALFLLVLIHFNTVHRVSGACESPLSRHSALETCLATNTSDPASVVISELYEQIKEAECELDDPSQFPPQYCSSSGEKFDFIVVGSGVGGCVTANRLTEDESTTVLLLEAGQNPPKTSKVPFYWPTLIMHDIDWQYRSEPEPTNGLGVRENMAVFPTARVLGGSTSFNQLSWLRGKPEVFDSWAENGNEGWDHASIDKYFRKVEDLNEKDIKALKDWQKYHSENGPVSVDSLETKGLKPITEALQNGCLELGDKLNPDFNGKSVMGLGDCLGTIKNGRRCSAASAYLTPIKQRTNLKVTREAFATKILIDENKKAYGVEYIDSNGKVVQVLANKEVIVSAGPANSPKLLMLSGIGPRDHLEELGIDVIQDLPVGKNLKDQPVHLGLAWNINYTRDVLSEEEKMYQFLTRKGTELSGIGLLKWMYLFNPNNSSDQPKLKLRFSEMDQGNEVGVGVLINATFFRDDIAQQYFDGVKDSFFIFLFLAVVDPKSSGRVELRSKNPFDPPKIFSGYLSDREDMNFMLEGIKKIEQLTATKGLQAFNARLTEIAPEECKKYPARSDDFRYCAMRYLVHPAANYVGTCKMGPDSDPTAVVDDQLRVRGIDCLRVIDSSTMPSLPTLASQAAAYMVSEKGVDMVRKTWNLFPLG